MPVVIVAIAACWVADRIIARGHDAVLVRKIVYCCGMLRGHDYSVRCICHDARVGALLERGLAGARGFEYANNPALCNLTLIPKPAIGLNAGLLTIATSLAGGVSASLSGWLPHIGRSYTLPMMSVCVFLLIEATGAIVLMRREWALKVSDEAFLEQRPA